MGTLRDAESILVAVNDRDQVHLRHFGGGSRNTTVVLLHGLCEDGSLYFRDGESLAPLLVGAGFDVWVPDLRGRGRSWPALAPGDDHGFHEAVTQDLATVMGVLREEVPDRPLFLLGHGTGALLWMSFLARWPIVREFVQGMVMIGGAVGREPGGSLFARLRAGPGADWMARRRGMVPGTVVGLGKGNEPVRFYKEVRSLLATGWIDPADGLDHAAQLRELPSWPPTLMLAAEADAPWGGPRAMRALQALLPPHDGRLYVFPAASGVRLLGPETALAGGAGARDIERLVLDWLANFDG